MPMKTNTSLRSLKLAAVQKLAPCPQGSAAVAPVQPPRSLFYFYPTAAWLQINYDLSNSVHPVMVFILGKMYSFIYTSEPCHRLGRRGPKGRAGAKQVQMCNRWCWSRGHCALPVTLGTDGWSDKHADTKRENTPLTFTPPSTLSLTPAGPDLTLCS